MKNKKILIGKVISDKSDKTLVVNIQRKYQHPFFKKVVKKNSKYHVHDEKNKYKTGQIVKIIQCRPISKKKRYEVIK